MLHKGIELSEEDQTKKVSAAEYLLNESQKSKNDSVELSAGKLAEQLEMDSARIKKILEGLVAKKCIVWKSHAQSIKVDKDVLKKSSMK